MSYKVFISHSTSDQRLVITLANLISKFGIKVSVAEWYLTPGKRLDKKVFEEINKSSCVVVLLTKDGIRSNWMQQEIGYALRAKKPLIPIVEKGVRAKDLGALQGSEYIVYNPRQPQPALVKASAYIKSLKLKKEDQEKFLLVTAGVMAFLLLIVLSAEK
jgi:hypothetical protein